MRILNKKNKQKKMLFSHVILCFLISLISLNGYSQTECSSFKKLEKAISKNDQKAINKLINGGININSCRDKEGNTCLMFAVSENNIEMTRFLIEKGAAVNRKNIKSQSTLILAVLTGNIELVELLIDKEADIENKSSDQIWVPLAVAIREGYFDIYNLLIQRGADINSKAFDKGIGYLSIAIINGYDSLAWDLIHKKVKIDIVSNENKTALHYAIEKQSDSISIYLINHTNNLEIIDEFGKTILNVAIENRNYIVFNSLLDKSIINRRDYNGLSPLHYSILTLDTLMFNQLLRNGADPNVYSFNDSLSPVLTAATTGIDYFSQTLLKHGVEIKVPLISAEFFYYTSYLYWQNALINRDKTDLFTNNKDEAYNFATLALELFKEEIATLRWKKTGIVALNVLAVAGSTTNDYLLASIVTNGLMSTSHLKPGLENSKLFRDKCTAMIEEIETYKN